MKPRIIAQAVTASFFAAAAATPAFAENIYETGLGLGVWTNMTIPLGTQAWFLGQDFSVLDPFCFMLCRWTRGFDDRPARSFAHIGPYLERVARRPAVRAAIEAEGLPAPWF